VDSFILCHPYEIIQTKSVPQDQQRLQVPGMFLNRTVQNLNEHIQGCVAELVFNLEEVGISDWEVREPRKVLVPATMRGHPAHHGISRTVKHIAVITFVSDAGESFTPYMITLQDSASVQEQRKKHGVRFRAELIMKLNSKP
jgi:hypothetical protein